MKRLFFYHQSSSEFLVCSQDIYRANGPALMKRERLTCGLGLTTAYVYDIYVLTTTHSPSCVKILHRADLASCSSRLFVSTIPCTAEPLVRVIRILVRSDVCFAPAATGPGSHTRMALNRRLTLNQYPLRGRGVFQVSPAYVVHHLHSRCHELGSV